MKYYQEPRYSYVLQASTKVSNIRSDVNRRRKQFVFRISWKCDDADGGEKANDAIATATNSSGAEANRHSRGQHGGAAANSGSCTGQGDGVASAAAAGTGSANKQRLGRMRGGVKDVDATNQQQQQHLSKESKTKEGISGTKVAAVTVGGVVVGALTAGVGLLAGMTVVGMSAAAGGGALLYGTNAEGQKEKYLMLASDSYHEAEMWTTALEAQISELNDSILGFSTAARNRTPQQLLARHRRRSFVSRPEVKMQRVEEWVKSSKWKVPLNRLIIEVHPFVSSVSLIFLLLNRCYS